eukprot:1194508-Prorocentrum_minimum.AAC.7
MRQRSFGSIAANGFYPTSVREAQAEVQLQVRPFSPDFPRGYYGTPAVHSVPEMDGVMRTLS